MYIYYTGKVYSCFSLYRLWQDVTNGLKNKDIDMATGGKRFLEQRQRDEAKERLEKGEKWQTKVNTFYIYIYRYR